MMTTTTTMTIMIMIMIMIMIIIIIIISPQDLLYGLGRKVLSQTYTGAGDVYVPLDAARARGEREQGRRRATGTEGGGERERGRETEGDRGGGREREIEL